MWQAGPQTAPSAEACLVVLVLPVFRPDAALEDRLQLLVVGIELVLLLVRQPRLAPALPGHAPCSARVVGPGC